MSSDSGEVKNWLPEDGETGKYVTILDLKERWMKKKQQEEEEEKRQKKLKEAENVHEDEKKKVCERFHELKIGGEKDRVEARLVGLGSGRKKSSGRSRGGRSDSSNNQIDARKGMVERSEVLGSRIDERKWKVEKIDYKKKGLEVDGVKVTGDDLVENYNGVVGDSCRGRRRGRYRSGKRFSRDLSSINGVVSDDAENVCIDVAVEKSEEVDCIGDQNGTRTDCPCHSKSKNQGGGGYWVCKYVEPAIIGRSQESLKGNDDVDMVMVDYIRTENGGKEELKQLKKHRVPSKVRDEMAVKKEKVDVMRVNGDTSGVFNHDDVSRKNWQPRDKLEIANGVKEELIAKDTRKEKVAAYKDSQRIINRVGMRQKNNVKLQSQTVEPSGEIEEQVLSVTERERIRKGKFGTRDCPVEGRQIYDSGRFKAAQNFGSLPMNCVNKDSAHVNSSCRKILNHGGSQHTIDGSALKLENIEPMDCPEKSEALLHTVIGENSSVRVRVTRNEIYPRKTFVNKRLQTARKIANERLSNSGKFYGERERWLEREGFMWVKKGEVSVGDAGRRK